MEEKKFCCDEFSKYTGKENEGFEISSAGTTWNINGCCHGGCFVVSGMKFCPFCGAELLKVI